MAKNESIPRVEKNRITKARMKFSIWLHILVLVLLSTFFCLITGISNSWADFEESITSAISIKISWSFTMIVLASAGFLFSSFLLVTHFFENDKKFALFRIVANLVILVLITAGNIAFLVLTKPLIAGVPLMAMNVFPFLPMFVLLALSLFYLISTLLVQKWMLALGAILLSKLSVIVYSIFIFILLSSIAITVFFAALNPCITDSKLPRKPLIIGHRGAPSEAPENTAESFRIASELDVYGVESDIRISSDGIPFALHDTTLTRTTNVRDVFPDRKGNDASTFTFKELQSLKANEYGMTNYFKYNWRNEYPNATIPSLSTLLTTARNHNKVVIFDLFQPFKDSKYYSLYSDITLRTTSSVFIDNPASVWWLFPVKPDSFDKRKNFVDKIKNQYNFKLACGIESRNDINSKNLDNCDIVNTKYSVLLHRDTTDEYIKNSWLNVFTVDKEWLFSFCWCVGVNSVTTNNSRMLSNLDSPLYRYPTVSYTLFVTFTYALSTGLFIFTNILARRAMMAMCREKNKYIAYSSNHLYKPINSINSIDSSDSSDDEDMEWIKQSNAN